MTDFHATLAGLRRPKLLIRAARLGVTEYRRERDLQRILQAELPTHRALPQLLEEEARLEETRRKGEATYSARRHIDLLIALMGEARTLPRLVASAA